MSPGVDKRSETKRKKDEIKKKKVAQKAWSMLAKIKHKEEAIHKKAADTLQKEKKKYVRRKN